MRESTIHIDAPPDKVFAELIKEWEAADPGTMKVGDHFVVRGESVTFTVTLLEPGTRFGLSWMYDDNTYTTDYAVLPDGSGTQVRLQMDVRSIKRPLTAWMVGFISEGRKEHELLDQLKGAVEKVSST
jgi:Polyketide cyclase / dehydrase and lipid transport